MSKLKVGVIGYRNHSQKLISLINNHNSVSQIITYCYRKEKVDELNRRKKKNIIYTSKLNDLDNCNSIIISSSTGTHINYLKKFINKKKYIYCEKPGPTNLKDITFLKNLTVKSKKKIFFGQNLIFSDLFYFLKKIIKSEAYGVPIYSTINITNGISFKKSMSKNWRFNSKSIFKKISGNVGVHYIGLMRFLLGNIQKIKISELGIKKKNKIDNTFIDLDFVKNFKCKIYLSYSTVFEEELRFFFSNGQLIFNGNQIYIYHPRDTFDRFKHFIKPKKKVLKTFKKSWVNNSLKNTINLFLKKCLLKENFNLNDYNHFLQINELLIKRK